MIIVEVSIVGRSLLTPCATARAASAQSANLSHATGWLWGMQSGEGAHFCDLGWHLQIPLFQFQVQLCQSSNEPFSAIITNTSLRNCNNSCPCTWTYV
jgi:hypothetical protein